jgi:hypothetical protein
VTDYTVSIISGLSPFLIITSETQTKGTRGWMEYKITSRRSLSNNGMMHGDDDEGLGRFKIGFWIPIQSNNREKGALQSPSIKKSHLSLGMGRVLWEKVKVDLLETIYLDSSPFISHPPNKVHTQHRTN